MSINERILELVKLKGYNKNSFSGKVGIKPQTLHHIISGRKTKPSFEVIEKILTAFDDINAEWLITGEGEPIKKNLFGANFDNNQSDDDINMACLECKCRDHKVIEMAKKIHELKQQITELKKDKEDLRMALKIYKMNFDKDDENS